MARFEHRMGEALNLGRRECALLCTLLLRGPQTPGELRGRSERMHRLEDLDEVQLVLQKLIEHDPPLVRAAAPAARNQGGSLCRPVRRTRVHGSGLERWLDTGRSDPASSGASRGLGARSASSRSKPRSPNCGTSLSFYASNLPIFAANLNPDLPNRRPGGVAS